VIYSHSTVVSINIVACVWFGRKSVNQSINQSCTILTWKFYNHFDLRCCLTSTLYFHSLSFISPSCNYIAIILDVARPILSTVCTKLATFSISSNHSRWQRCQIIVVINHREIVVKVSRINRWNVRTILKID